MTSSVSATVRWLGGVALGAALVTLLIVRHHYAGLSHDSQLYTLLAAARLAPDLLGNDIMLRFGSQDSFTLFSPIYAAAIGVLGAEPAAAIVTLASLVAFIASAILLARRLVPAPYVWLGLALICAMPGYYGARSIFSIVETFATPRLLAEALVLSGLTALLAHRIRVAGVLALAATAIHPLIAAAGLVVGLYLMPAPPRTKKWITVGALVVAAAGFALLAARGEQFLLDDAWLRLLQSGTDYLFPSLWPISSWGREAVLLATLAVGALVLEPSPARSFCIAAGLAAAAGTLIGYIGGDVLRIALVVQLQLWRWNWIAMIAALLLLPFVGASGWSKGGLWRAVVLLLGAAWLVMAHALATFVVLAVLVVITAIARRPTATTGAAPGAPTPACKPASAPSPARALFMVAAILAGLAVLLHLALIVMAAGTGLEDPRTPAWINTLRAFGRMGVLPWIAFLAVFVLVVRTSALAGKALGCVACTLLLAALLPNTIREWNARSYSPERFQAFQAWRDRIQPGTEVLWLDSPLSSWLLLQRPSYLSNQQEATALFSRSAAMAMKARVDAIAPHLEPATFIGWSSRRPVAPVAATNAAINLAGLCTNPDLKYVVSRNELPGTPPIAPPLAGAWLYGCAAPHTTARSP